MGEINMFGRIFYLFSVYICLHILCVYILYIYVCVHIYIHYTYTLCVFV